MRATSPPSMLAFGLILMTLACHCYGDCLQVGFYKGKCGKIDIEEFIHKVVKRMITAEPDVVSDLTRLLFHDCFVRGCDASVFLDGPDTEKTAALNLDLGGFDTMDEIKEAVEKVCPGVVSCADVLIMATRSAVKEAGGLNFDVETGRRDSLVSLKSEADANIPPATISIPDTMKLFASKGLDKDDVVVLLGSHTVGTAHCHSFKDRLYNFRGTNKPDPRMNKQLLKELQHTCPVEPTTPEGEAFLDQTPNSNFTIDNDYYKQILAHNGTIEIDENLADNPLTRDRVKELASNNHKFIKHFGPAIVKMSRIGVLTGNQGEIRKSCHVRNGNVGNYYVRSE